MNLAHSRGRDLTCSLQVPRHPRLCLSSNLAPLLLILNSLPLFPSTDSRPQSCPCDHLGAVRPCTPQIATQQNHRGGIADLEVSHEARHQTVSAVPGAEVDRNHEVDPHLIPAVLAAKGVDVTEARVTVALPAQIRVLPRAQR